MTDIPDPLLERAKMLEGILISAATGGEHQDTAYGTIRADFMSNSVLKPLLPEFVRLYRNLDAFWPYIKNEAGTYAERRQIIGLAFNPLIEHLEGANLKPSDSVNSDTLQSFDSTDVHRVWQKALDRRKSDPEGAITVARTLLETVCKSVLDKNDNGSYSEKDDLPTLYRKASKTLNLAPDQHSEEVFKSILGSAANIVNGIGSLRNKLSDAHGRGGAPILPSERHANFVVNIAGATATFLVETYAARTTKSE